MRRCVRNKIADCVRLLKGLRFRTPSQIKTLDSIGSLFETKSLNQALFFKRKVDKIGLFNIVLAELPVLRCRDVESSAREPWQAFRLSVDIMT